MIPSKPVPPDFISRISQQLGSKTQAFLEALNHPPSPAIRYNPAKAKVPFVGQPIPWEPFGRILPERPVYALDPIFHAGGYYVQEPSSMILGFLIPQLLSYFPEAPLWLDLCAAPGGKSTHLLSFLPDDGLLISNETDPHRASILHENLFRWGNPRFLFTREGAHKWNQIQECFDLILLDAPCSGEGMFRKDDFAITQWTPDLVQQCAHRQTDLLANILPTLKPGGFLIYSTCTFAPEENINQLLPYLESGDLQAIRLTNPPTDWGWERIQPSISAWQTWFHTSLGEGLFCAVLQKPGKLEELDLPPLKIFKKNKPFTTIPHLPELMPHLSWAETPEAIRLVPNLAKPFQPYLEKYHIRSTAGIPAGKIQQNRWTPSQELAWWPDLPMEGFKTLEVSLPQALDYLRRDTVHWHQSGNRGMHLITYQNLALGWMHLLEGRSNNLYPIPYRLRMR
jgi:16S rRNA C967 or C1407 C5-methylase (RsmB/RsmF family)/NOL1/NOP2/fmu family ribosome biogenesis protein